MLATSRRRRDQTRLVLVSLALSLGLSPAGHAAQFCVSSGTMLANALDVAEGNGQSDDVRIVQGVISGTNLNGGVIPRWHYRPLTMGDLHSSLTLSGGWNANCTAQTADARLTELDAQYHGTALHFELSSDASVVVRNLTVSRGYHNGSTLVSDVHGANISADIEWSDGGAVTLENLVVVTGMSSNGATAAGIGFRGAAPFQGGSGYRAVITVRNVIVAYNTVSGNLGSAIRLNANESRVYVNNNTIFENAAGAIESIQSGNFRYFSNNAIFNNVDTHLQPEVEVTSTAFAFLSNNHVEGTVAMDPNIGILGAHTTGDPQVDVVGIVPMPMAGSPLRDSGKNGAPGGIGTVDAVGKARIANATVDRGAVEAAALPPPVLPDSVFADGFE
jgi:hypothetical protein